MSSKGNTLFERLRQNGQEVTSAGTYGKILVPQLSTTREATLTCESMLFLLMEKDTFRQELHGWAYGDATTIASKDVAGYLRLLKFFDKATAKDLESNLSHRQGRYNATYEWFIKELLLKRFGAKAAEFGVTLQDAPADEFDVIAATDNGIVFAECGAGMKKNIFDQDTMKKFMNRDSFLDANYSFFLFDRQDIFGGIDPTSLTVSEAQSRGIFRVEKIIRLDNKRPKTIFYRVDTTVASGWFLAASTYSSPKDVLQDMLMFTYLTGRNAWIKHFKPEAINFIR